ncbi:hypothetical protein PG997_011585 [Apiospora hydei]|uniref:Uncharacterized protein n=1 Tax=Apiospora hydei TaxID=1337664 RepID=A0ABR1VJR9_9PEZI
MAVLVLDNARHGLQFPTIASKAWDRMISARRFLRLRYQQSDSIEHVEGRAPLKLSDPEQNEVVYSQLLDYILGTMSWWLMRCAQSQYWKKHLIAILAKWAVKIKIVAFDPQASAEASLNQITETIDSMKAEAEFREVILMVGGKERDISTFDTETDMSSMYFEDKMVLRELLSVSSPASWMPWWCRRDLEPTPDPSRCAP